ncbi:MAG TPA: hypothetical protein VGF68_00735 [Solirubrobacteraceae bacterium]|jgi:hypothetical protein
MTTILVINAISSVVVAAGLGAIVRRGRRAAPVQPLYVTTGARRRRLR